MFFIDPNCPHLHIHQGNNIRDEQWCVHLVQSQHGSFIKYISNPNDTIKFAAIRNTPEAIRAIDNPTDEMWMEAIKENNFLINYNKNPTEEMQLMAVRKSPAFIIKEIKNPTERVLLEALKVAWSEGSYNYIIYFFEDTITPWFHKEVKRLKLTKGPMEHDLRK